MRLKINRLKQRGDTIVEVLIAIAVISLILSISYALANRSSQATRQAQERSEALKIGEDQLESLRAYLENNGDSGIPASGFCFAHSGGSFTTTSGSDCKKGPQGRYDINITKNGDLYRVILTWDTVGGRTVKDTMTLSYRLSPEDIEYQDEPAETGGGGGGGATPENLVLTVSNPGARGTVTGSGINCGQGNADCSETYSSDTSISLTATPAANYVFDDGWSTDCAGGTLTIMQNTTCTASFVHVPRVPLYRCYSTLDTNHYYTVHSILCNRNLGGSVLYEGVVGYVPTGGYSAYPYDYVYGGYNAAIGDSFYTTNYDPEYLWAHNHGWNMGSGYQGWRLYPANCPVPGTIPLYRKVHSGVGDHFYTTNYAEANWYTYEGVQGCLFSNP